MYVLQQKHDGILKNAIITNPATLCIFLSTFNYSKFVRITLCVFCCQFVLLLFVFSNTTNKQKCGAINVANFFHFFFVLFCVLNMCGFVTKVTFSFLFFIVCVQSNGGRMLHAESLQTPATFFFDAILRVCFFIFYFFKNKKQKNTKKTKQNTKSDDFHGCMKWTFWLTKQEELCVKDASWTPGFLFVCFCFLVSVACDTIFFLHIWIEGKQSKKPKPLLCHTCLWSRAKQQKNKKNFVFFNLGDIELYGGCFLFFVFFFNFIFSPFCFVNIWFCLFCENKNWCVLFFCL